MKGLESENAHGCLRLKMHFKDRWCYVGVATLPMTMERLRWTVVPGRRYPRHRCSKVRAGAAEGGSGLTAEVSGCHLHSNLEMWGLPEDLLSASGGLEGDH